MDALQAFLEQLKRLKLTEGHLLGLLHILIGRKITREDGAALSSGLSWRELAALLKKVRWDREAVRELGLDPEELSPRDRERFWFLAVSRARVHTPEARRAGDELAALLKKHGYVVGPAPKAGD